MAFLVLKILKVQLDTETLTKSIPAVSTLKYLQHCQLCCVRLCRLHRINNIVLRESRVELK